MANLAAPIKRDWNISVESRTIADQVPSGGIFPTQATVPSGTTIYKGGLYCINASGVIVVPDTSASTFAIGIFEGWTSAGGYTDTVVGDSAILVSLTIGAVWLPNSATNAATLASLQTTAYAEDSNTVGTVVGSTRRAAGKIIAFDPIRNMVCVDMTQA